MCPSLTLTTPSFALELLWLSEQIGGRLRDQSQWSGQASTPQPADPVIQRPLKRQWLNGTTCDDVLMQHCHLEHSRQLQTTVLHIQARIAISPRIPRNRYYPRTTISQSNRIPSHHEALHPRVPGDPSRRWRCRHATPKAGHCLVPRRHARQCRRDRHERDQGRGRIHHPRVQDLQVRCRSSMLLSLLIAGLPCPPTLSAHN